VKRPELGGGWTLWPQVLVRGAGFELARLDALRGTEASARLREVASEAHFREAVTWQNREAVVNGLDSLLRQPPGATDSRTRKKERMVARYLQRYCAKCDTIGFFGPVGWGSWRGGSGRFAPGASLIDARATFFEPWAVRAVMDASSERAVVSLPPQFRLTSRGVEAPGGVYAPLRAEWPVLRKLARGPVAVSKLPRDAVARLLEQGVVMQRHPVSVAHVPARVPVELEALRQRVAGSAGDASELGVALGALESAFTSLTEASAKRNAGKTYGGRGLVYEECRRGISLELSAAALEAVREPLAVLLQVSRWFTFQIARRFARRLAALKTNDFAELWQQADALFVRPTHVTQTARELSQRWEKLWGTSRQLDPQDARVEKLFAAPCPGWPGARHHAPDLMWAAESAKQLLRGEGTPVLSELHPGVNPFTTLSVLALCPDRRVLEKEWALDFEEAGISPVPFEDFARSSQDARLAKEHFHLEEGGPFDSDRPAKQRIRLADLKLVRAGGRMFAQHGKRRFDLLAVFERRIKLQAAAAFSLAQPGAHVARRLLGRLLVQRETWRFDSVAVPEDLDAWREEHRMPERVFVRVPTEVKPIYVDFKAPVLVENLKHMLNGAPSFSVQEMFPGPGELWLSDAEDKRYVAELRTLAVDPVPFDGSSVWVSTRGRSSQRRRR
jgi:hypothetical protein